MASIIRLRLGHQESFREFKDVPFAIRSPFFPPTQGNIRPVIAKGNIIEGIEAKT